MSAAARRRLPAAAAPVRAALPASLDGREVLVLGLGASGLAMARWCLGRGARVAFWDSRAHTPQIEALVREAPAARRLAVLPTTVDEGLGHAAAAGVGAGAAVAMPADAVTTVADSAAAVAGAAAATVGGDPAAARWTLVAKSPGLSPHDARLAPLLASARTAGVPVCGELDLFVRSLAALREADGYAPALLAVTGTNGKTTVTAMTALLAARAGRRVAAAGNIGPTLLDTLAARCAGERADWPEVWVLELSSFQLDGGGDGVDGFEPTASAVLNVTQDHLDWHGSLDAYAAAKARVFGARTVRVVRRDDARCEAMAAPPPTARPRAPKAVRAAPPPVVRFGLDAPCRAGDFGVVEANGIAWLARALPDDDAAPSRRRGAVAAAGWHVQHLMPADALRVRGRHNAANALAALALASAVGCPLAPLLHALREYRGEPHRVEPVAVVDGVEAYDDSKGTNVGATVAALDGLGAERAPGRLAVILGGQGKGQDFGPLAAPLARHARAVATLGADAAAIEAAIGPALDGAAVPLQRCATLPEAVRWCFAQARAGDAVLLSPACASLDMFRDYGHRAEVFVAAVHDVAADAGVVA